MTTSKEAGAGQPEDLYVVTENGEQCFLWKSNQLTYIAQDRHEIPAILATKFGHLATRLDLSYNSLTSFKNINSFTNLNELILDNNSLEDDQLELAFSLRLKTLSLNKNKLTNLYKLVNTIKVCLPNLEYLSLIGNPLCPKSLLSCAQNSAGSKTPAAGVHSKKPGANQIDELVLDDSSLNFQAHSRNPYNCLSSGHMSSEFCEQKYRHFIIYHLPNLRFLDSSPITPSERDEALRRCFWMSQATVNQLNDLNRYRLGHTQSDARAHHRARDHSEESTRSTDNNTDTAAAAAATTTDGDGQFRLTIMSSNTNNSNDVGEQHRGQPRGVFSRLAYKYTGKNSEGNRFIRNQDL